MGRASSAGVAHNGRAGRRPVVVGRWVRVVECPHPGTADVVLVHHGNKRYQPMSTPHALRQCPLCHSLCTAKEGFSIYRVTLPDLNFQLHKNTPA